MSLAAEQKISIQRHEQILAIGIDAFALMSPFSGLSKPARLFLRIGRHLLQTANYRVLRGRAFVVWQEATCVQ